jgi:hypothetical protein
MRIVCGVAMDKAGIVVDDLAVAIDSFASSASISKGAPRSKENGPNVSLHRAISAWRLAAQSC